MSQFHRGFSDLSVRQQISIGFVPVLLLVLAIVTASYIRFSLVEDGFSTYSQRVLVVDLSRAIDRRFVDMRRHVREFALTGGAADAQAAKEDVDRLAAEIADAVAEIRNPERHRLILQVQEGFAVYRLGLDRVLAFKTQLDALIVGRLDRFGSAAKTELDSMIGKFQGDERTDTLVLTQASLESLMELRLAVNKMLGRHDTSLIQEADRSAGTLRDRMARLRDLVQDRPERVTVDQVQEQVVAYVEAFHQARDLHEQLGTAVNGVMRQNAEMVAAASQGVVEAAVREEHSIAGELHGTIIGTKFLLVGLAVGGLVLGTAAAMLIGRAIARPIAAITEAMHSLASGELDTDIPAQGRRDELGKMARALLVFRQSAAAERRMQQEEAANVALRARRQSAMDQHTRDFGATIAAVMLRLVQSAETMREAAASTSAASERTFVSAAETAVGASQSSRSLSAISAATEQMSVSINGIGERVRDAAHESGVAAAQAAATDDKVSGLALAAERIGNVVQIITRIAGQTNLLALNATIEAARAGEAGRGFSVVATEVKNLAQQTARATTEIGSEINAIRNATAAAVSAVQDTTLAIGRVSAVARDIADAVQRQGVATSEIAGSVQAVTATTQAACASMQEVSAIAEGAESTTKNVKETADAIGQIASKLHEEVNYFLRAMNDCTTDQNRRRYERVSGGNTPITLVAAGAVPRAAALIDISRSGAACRCDEPAELGQDAELHFSGLEPPIPGRIVRSSNGIIAVAFLQSENTVELIDRLLERFQDAA